MVLLVTDHHYSQGRDTHRLNVSIQMCKDRRRRMEFSAMSEALLQIDCLKGRFRVRALAFLVPGAGHKLQASGLYKAFPK